MKTEVNTADHPYVLALIGSRRKKNTWSLAESLRPHVEAAGFNLIVESIYDVDLRDCVGCHHCVEGGECSIRDDMDELKARMEGAAGLVLASPVYMCGVSGKLKSAIDRTAAWFHRPVLSGKPGLVLVTTAGSYQKDTFRYLTTIMMHWGLLHTGGAIRNAGSVDKPLTAKEVSTFIKVLREGPPSFSPSFRQLTLFQVQKVLAQRIMPVDLAYWNTHGWTKRSFYVNCHIPAWKRTLAWLFHRMLYSSIKGFNADE